MHTASDPKHVNRWYEELCALAAIGELSSIEFEDLRQHLADCGECRDLYADFCRMAADDLGGVAVRDRASDVSEIESSSLDENDLLERFMERAKRERAAATSVTLAGPKIETEPPFFASVTRFVNFLRKPVLSYAAVGLLLCAVAATAAYKLKEAQLTPTLAELQSEVTHWRNRAQAVAADQESTAQQLQESAEQLRRSKIEQGALQKSLTEVQARDSALRAQQNSLELELATAVARAEEQGKELRAANAVAEEKGRQVAKLQTQVDNAVQRTEDQRRIAENLQLKLDWARQSERAVTPESQAFNDVDAKDLFGARDLHIVDVYDVASNGATRRSYGRVYYVEKKLLIFYAFDLQDKKRNRGAVAFQAWGYRQPNEEKPENLGLFSIDDASKNRWVLKVNNPRILEHIDAVFVTAENPKGSSSPRGQKLMYANLAAPPNHP